jgi:hypothetical protein
VRVHRVDERAVEVEDQRLRQLSSPGLGHDVLDLLHSSAAYAGRSLPHPDCL